MGAFHTQFQETPPLSCSPDAGFALSLNGHTKAFYLEQDRATSSPRQIAARKHRGYAEMQVQQPHRVHFPESNLDRFSVLCVTTSRARRDELAKALGKKPATDNWLFASNRGNGVRRRLAVGLQRHTEQPPAETEPEMQTLTPLIDPRHV